MMKWLAPALVIFALLTDPQGRIIYIAKEAVVAVTAPVRGECDKDAHSKIYTSTVQFCVAEDPADARNKIEGRNAAATTN
jgi:hypothetical protein